MQEGCHFKLYPNFQFTNGIITHNALW